MNKQNLLASASFLSIMGGGLLQLLGFQNLAGISMFGIAALGWLLFRNQSRAAKHNKAMRKQVAENERLIEGIRGTMRWYGTQLLNYGDSTFKRIKVLENQDVEDKPNTQIPKLSQQVDTYFSPLHVKPSRILDKPSAHFAGRLAAEQKNSGQSAQVFSQLLNSLSLSHRRKILLMGSSWMSARLQEMGDITIVTPGREANLVDSETAYFIIDEAIAQAGPWSGVFDAQGTSKFFSLYKSIRTAKDIGTVIVVIASDAPGHYTGLLHGMADVLVENGHAKLEWDTDIHLPVIRKIESLVQENNKSV